MTTSIKLGVAFDLNGQAISLQPKEAIEEIKAKGIELTLPEKVELGTAGEGVDSILEKLGSDYCAVKPENPDPKKSYIEDKLPDFQLLKDAYKKVVAAQLNVEKFHAKIPGSETKNPDGTLQTETKYTIGLSATWDLTGHETGLTLTGIYFEISNESAPVVPAETKSEGKTKAE